MVVAIVCAAAVLLSLGLLAVLAGGLLRRLRDLDARLEITRKQVTALNDALAREPRD